MVEFMVGFVTELGGYFLEGCLGLLDRVEGNIERVVENSMDYLFEISFL